MLEITIPGHETLHLAHLVLDYNGTLACDGRLLDGVAERLQTLAAQLQVHVLTADTFGSVRAAMADLPCTVYILPPGAQDAGKLAYVERLPAGRCVCIGNGRNDHRMLEAAALGVVVVQEEGAAVQTLLAADVAAPTILAALDLLSEPNRLAATLRS